MRALAIGLLFISLALRFVSPVQAAPFDAGFTHTSPTGVGDYMVSWQGAYTGKPYYIQYSSDGSSWSTLSGNTGSLIENQKGFGAHHYRIIEHSMVMTMGALIPIHLNTSTPYTVDIPVTTPTGFSVPVNGSIETTITWDEVVGADTYVLEQQIDGGAWETVYSGALLSWDIPVNAGSGTYAFRMRACFDALCSANTAEQSIVLGSPPSPTPFTMPTHDPAVGAIGGRHSVGQDGSANYSIPIALPTGVGGIHPELSISYNSNGSNGLLGLGWSLTGLSAIHYCDRKYKDNDFFYPSLEFCLDGERLRHDSDASEPNPEFLEYHLENAIYSKVILHNPNNDPLTSLQAGSWWEVKLRSGETLYYGNTVNAAVEANGHNAGKINVWAVSKRFDRFNNSINFSYVEDTANGDYRIDQITYLEGQVSVDFEYTNRNDVVTQYFGGSSVNKSKRLKKIDVTTGGIVLANYTLEYHDDEVPDGYPSQLKSIQQCSGIGSAIACLPLTTFSWENQQPVASFSVANSHAPPIGFVRGSGGEDNGTRLVDLDGDGLTDIVHAYKNTAHAWLKTPAGWEEANEYAPPRSIIESNASSNGDAGSRLVDVNGDGMTDFLHAQANPFFPVEDRGGVWLNTGAGWGSSAEYSLPAGFVVPIASTFDQSNRDFGLRTSDVNNDGLVDLLLSHNLNLGSGIPLQERRYAWINTGKRWREDEHYAPPFAFFGIPSSSAASGDIGSRLIDLNGDGEIDLLHGYDNDPRKAWLNSGGGTWNETPEFAPPANITKWENNAPQSASVTGNRVDQGMHFVDLNGDGLTDLVRAKSGDLNAWLNTGYQWQHAPEYAPPAPAVNWLGEDQGVRFIDINFDGRVDILSAREGSPREAWLNNGAGWSSAGSYNLDFDFVSSTGQDRGVRFADINGDGFVDVLRSGYGTSLARLNNNAHPRLKSVINGMGLNTTFTYKPLTDPSVYTKGSGAIFPAQDVQPSQYVVSKVAQSDGLGGALTSSYSYEGLKIHNLGQGQRTGLGSLGFRTMTVLNEDTGIATRTTYSQDYEAHTHRRAESIETVALAETVPANDFVQSQLDLAHSDWDQWRSNGNVISYTENTWKTLIELPPHNSSDEWLLAGGEVVTSTDFWDDLFDIQALTCANGILELSNVHFKYEFGGGTPLPDLLAEWENIVQCIALRYHSRLVATKITKNDLNGKPLSHEVNEYTYDDYDNIKTIYTQLYDVPDGTLFREKLTVNHYKNNGGDEDNWLFGQIEQMDVTVTLNDPNNPSTITRKSGFEYDSTTGLKTAEVILDPASTETNWIELQRTAYSAIDSFGNPTVTTVSGPDFATRSVTSTFDATGRYVASTSQTVNGIVHDTSTTFYALSDFLNGAYPGKVDTFTDANGMQTKHKYDVFGRKVETISAYGTADPVSSFSAFERCGNITGAAVPCADKTDPDTGLVVAKPVYRITEFAEGGAGVHVFVDQLGREVKRASQSVDGRFVIVGNGYDGLGHNTQVCEPYFMGEDEYVTKIEYDVLGRAIKSHNPFTDTNGNTFYSIDTVEYDGLTRVSTNDINGLNQKKTQTRDPMGNLVKVIDNMTNEVTYQYDALSNMTKVTAPLLAANDQDSTGSLPVGYNVTTITYDDLGRKTSMNDPDKGDWSYTYNGLGELITQTNAKGEVSCTAYDTLGRKVKRIDNYAGTIATTVGGTSDSTNGNGCENPGDDTETAEWFYDLATNKGKGKLWKSINTTYVGGTPSVGKQTTLAYDATYGRVTSTTDVIAGTSYVTQTSYDSLHRPETVTYPTHGGNALAVTTTYNSLGFPVSLKNAANDDKYYVLLGTDAYGNVVKEQYGNGVTTTRDYDPRSNRLKGIVSHALFDLNGPTVQNLDMTFDVIGNLTERNDHLQGIFETFGYDNLNRLTDMWLTMADAPPVATPTHGPVHTQVKYDALGNILEKGGIGIYEYGGNQSCAGVSGVQAGPHAVTKITGGAVGLKNTGYCYDANGNMIAGDGRTIDYTYFDKPAQIQKGTYTTYLDYDAERNRFRRVDDNNGEQTTYTYVGAYEKVVHHNGKVEERHYIGDFALITKETVSGQTNTFDRYLHKDHLGSTTVITDYLGNIVEQHSFDPWGKRRARSLPDLETLLDEQFENLTNFQRTSFTLSAFSLTSQFTNKGFTGHEQMDGVGLIHMGGRVYDAEIGRFLSADPFVQDRTSLQNLNRYTYVNNNPLSYTDPTGYFFKKLFKKLWKAIKQVHKVAFDYLVRKPLLAVGRLINAVPYLSTAVGLVLSVIPATAAFAPLYFQIMAGLNAAVALANGASIVDVATGFAVGAVTSGIGAGLVKAAADSFKVAVGYASGGLLGGIASKAMGGKFADGFAGGLAGAAVRHAQGDFAGDNKVEVVESEGEINTRGMIASTDPEFGFENNQNSVGSFVPPEHQEAFQKFYALATDAVEAVDTSCTVVCDIPWIGPIVRGRLIHRAFQTRIDSLGSNYFHSEVSYLNGNLSSYGTAGSVRADGVFGLQTEPQFIIELKTGGARMTNRELQRYRQNLPRGTDIYRIEEREFDSR